MLGLQVGEEISSPDISNFLLWLLFFCSFVFIHISVRIYKCLAKSSFHTHLTHQCHCDTDKASKATVCILFPDNQHFNSGTDCPFTTIYCVRGNHSTGKRIQGFSPTKHLDYNILRSHMICSFPPVNYCMRETWVIQELSASLWKHRHQLCLIGAEFNWWSVTDIFKSTFWMNSKFFIFLNTPMFAMLCSLIGLHYLWTMAINTE